MGHTCHALWVDPVGPCENCPTLRVFETKQSEHTRYAHPPMAGFGMRPDRDKGDSQEAAEHDRGLSQLLVGQEPVWALARPGSHCCNGRRGPVDDCREFDGWEKPIIIF